MRRKNIFEFCILGLFIMCMGLALSAALEYVTVGSEREFLGQGKWMLSLLAISLMAFFSARFINKAGGKLSLPVKTGMAATVCILFFFLGLWLRIWVIENIPIEPDSDFETYYRMAMELYNDTMLTPAAALDRRYAAMYPHTIGFPMLILQPAFHFFGPSVKTALYANLVCSMISVIIAGHIGQRMGGRLGAVVAVIAMSMWPSHILYSNMVATEQSFTMFMLLAADIMVHVLQRRKGSMYENSPIRALALLFLLGIVLAVGGAIRPMAMVLLAAYAVVQLFVSGDPSGEIPQTGARWALARGWLCVVIVMIPYLLTGNILTRNISDTILTEPASGLTASGYNLMVGVNSSAGGRWNKEDSDFFGAVFDETGDANAAHSACMQVAIQRVTQSPEDVLNLLVYKYRDLWQTDDFGIDWNLQWTDMQGTLTPELKDLLESVRPVGRLAYMAVLLFALLGAIEAWRKNTAPPPMQMVCILFFLGTALAHMLLETQVRYHYNMLPFLIILATQAMTGWRQRMAEEPAVKLVKVSGMDGDQPMTDHTHFDMHKALREGHIHMSISEAVAINAVNDTRALPDEPVIDEPDVAEECVPAGEEIAVETVETELVPQEEFAAEEIPGEEPVLEAIVEEIPNNEPQEEHAAEAIPEEAPEMDVLAEENEEPQVESVPEDAAWEGTAVEIAANEASEAYEVPEDAVPAAVPDEPQDILVVNIPDPVVTYERSRRADRYVQPDMLFEAPAAKPAPVEKKQVDVPVSVKPRPAVRQLPPSSTIRRERVSSRREKARPSSMDRQAMTSRTVERRKNVQARRKHRRRAGIR